ncbi:MAG TPA: glycosyltransferase family 39 protein [Polyangiaceae bacterium]|nr:glycosyltransferase family 39 protein [Polyangiaceae bacterium]
MTEPSVPSAKPDAPLAPPGNARRPLALAFALLPLGVLFLLMSTDRHFSFSVPAGVALTLLATAGVLDFMGTFDDRREASGPLPALAGPRPVELLGSIVLLVAVLRLAVAGRLPYGNAGAAFGVTATLLWAIISGFRALGALGIVDETRPLHTRWGFWLVVLDVVLVVPLLGAYSLSDPWETHYGEVAREMLSRDDWISTWWAQENWFWSKPVLDFWLQALSFSTLGVAFQPDQMLATAKLGFVPHPEWAARLPVFLLMLPASYLVYRAVAKRFGGRAGFLGGLVLATAPHWYVLGRQSMTDMPYVAPLTAALGCALLALGTDPERRATVYPVRVGKRTVGLSAYHLVIGVVIAGVIPQVLYLFSRHLSFQTLESRGFRWHLDEILYGSPGNCELPGNEACRWTAPVDPVLQPGLAALIWLAILALFLWANRGERRVQRLYFIAAWVLTALSAMAKGAPGLVLPIVVVVAAVGAARRWADFARLELVSMMLIVACLCLPWYVQMYARHGAPFTDRLLFHDMYKRAFVHVHDTNTGDDVSFRYYIWQLGYGLFPWTGLGVAGLLGTQREGDEAKSPRAEGLGFLLLWFAIAFSLFTISLTKFHHYILPAVPPIAVLTGIVLDRALPARAPSGRDLAFYLALMSGSALLFLGGALELFPASFVGRVPAPAASPLAAGVCIAGGAALLVLAVRRWPAPAEPTESDGYARAVTAAFGLAAAVIVLLVGRDLSSVDDPEGPARLTFLASYNYARPWPTNLDFRGVLAAVTLVSALGAVALAVPRLRHHAVVLVTCAGVWAAAWALDVYIVRAAPHWGQRETILEYYRRRKGPEEPLVAFQMNWKGENFYTGNHIPAFVSSGSKFKTWLKDERDRGTTVVYFTTEHTRESTLKTELGKVEKFELLTTKDQNNKFFLARVVL